MIVVLDASAAAEIVKQTQAGVDYINALMRSEKVLAPDLYVAEIGNFMWKNGRQDSVRADTLANMADECIGYIDEYVSSYELWKEALRLALEQDHPVYDMLYAVLARRHDAVLLTMDRRLCDVCERLSIRYKGAGTA